MTRSTSSVLEQAREAQRRGRWAEARPAFRAALSEALDADDLPVAAECALGLSGLWVNEIRAPDEYVAQRELLQGLAGRLTGRDDILGARLRARIAAEAIYGEAGDPAALAAAVDALRDADPTAYAEALSLLHHTLLAPHDLTERADNLAELMRATARAGDRGLALMALTWTTIDAVLAGDPDAPRMLNRMRERARLLDHAVLEYTAETVETMLMLRAGRLAEAEARLPEVAELGRAAGEVDADVFFGGQFLAVRWLEGRVSELLDLARAMADTENLSRFNRVYPAVVAAISAELGEHDEARVALARVAPFSPPPEGLEPSTVWTFTMFAVAEALHELGEADAARAAYAALEPFAELPIIGSIGVVCFGSVHWSLARCADTWGDSDRAIAHFEAAIAGNLRLGNLPMVAMSRAELARVLGDRDRPGDAAAAGTLLEQAISAGTRFGMSHRVTAWRAAASSLGGAAVEPEGRLVRRGDLWEITVGDLSVIVPHSVGIELIAGLVVCPHQEVPVTALAGVELPDNPQELLDQSARRALEHRRDELTTELGRASGDASRRAVTDELTEIDDALRAATGLGGRSRTFVDVTERARTSTQKAIRRTIERIGSESPELAASFRGSIRTGVLCRFDPDGSLPERWRVDRT